MPPRPPRPVTFRCEWCSELRTEDRPPGPAPRYCQKCKADAQRSLTMLRTRAWRERHADPYAARRAAEERVGAGVCL